MTAYYSWVCVTLYGGMNFAAVINIPDQLTLNQSKVRFSCVGLT